MLGLNRTQLANRYLEILQENEVWIKDRLQESFQDCKQRDDYVECATHEVTMSLLPVLLMQLIADNNKVLSAQLSHLAGERADHTISE